MRDKEIVGLYQAYLDVYSNLNEEVEQLDEISPEVIAGTDLKRRKNLDAAEKKEMGARDAGATMGELSRLSANTSKAADKVSRHRRLSSAHARSRARMNKEEVENWVNSLIEEGYDLSEYTWDDMYEMYVTEADSIAAMRERAAKRRKQRYGASDTSRGGRDDFAPITDYEAANKKWARPTQKEEADSIAAMRERAAKRRKQRYGASDTSRGGRDDFAPITDYEAANKKWARPTQKEETDLFGAILEHLVAEGYADTNESALAIMANMSEEWRQSIVEEVLEEGKKEFPETKVREKAAKHEEDYIKKRNPKSMRLARKMKGIASTVEVGDDPRNTMHGQDLRKIK